MFSIYQNGEYSRSPLVAQFSPKNSLFLTV